MEPYPSKHRSRLKVQTPEQIASRDERNRYLRDVATKDSYWVAVAAMLLASGHELAVSGSIELFVAVIASVGISGLFLLVRRWQLNRNVPTDERTARLVLRSFGWANSIFMVGLLTYFCYWAYLQLTGQLGAFQSGVVFIHPMTLSLATMWATYLRNNVAGYHVTYWLTILQFALVMPVKLHMDLTRGGLFLLILNPAWIFLAFAGYMSVSVIRHEQLKQEGPLDE